MGQNLFVDFLFHFLYNTATDYNYFGNVNERLDTTYVLLYNEMGRNAAYTEYARGGYYTRGKISIKLYSYQCICVIVCVFYYIKIRNLK